MDKDVMIKILSKLPRKDVIKFKCVSRTWNQWLSKDPLFLKWHFDPTIEASKSNSNPGILISRSEGPGNIQLYWAQDYTSCGNLTRFEVPIDEFRIVNSCDGLICVTPLDDKECFVCNPLTGDYTAVPCPPIPSYICSQNEVDNPSPGINIMFGFGFNRASDQYKLIRFVSTSVFQMNVERHSHVDVHTLGTSTWRALQEFVPYNLSCFNRSTVLVNGALHWFCYKLVPREGVIPSLDTLIAFDLQQESVQEILQPDGIVYDDFFSEVIVGEMGGQLCIFCSLIEKYVDIWVMKEYGFTNSWTRQYRIGRSKVSGPYAMLTPMGVTNSGEILIDKSRVLIMYDPATNSVKDLHRFGNDVVNLRTFKASLLSPTIINGASGPSWPQND